MPENPDLSAIRKQLEDLTALMKQSQDETNPPKWWKKQESRLSTLESKLETNQRYEQQIHGEKGMGQLSLGESKPIFLTPKRMLSVAIEGTYNVSQMFDKMSASVASIVFPSITSTMKANSRLQQNISLVRYTKLISRENRLQQNVSLVGYTKLISRENRLQQNVSLVGYTKLISRENQELPMSVQVATFQPFVVDLSRLLEGETQMVINSQKQLVDFPSKAKLGIPSIFSGLLKLFHDSKNALGSLCFGIDCFHAWCNLKVNGTRKKLSSPKGGYRYIVGYNFERMRSSIHHSKSESGPLGTGNNSFVAKKNNVVSYEVEKGKRVDCRSKEKNEKVVSGQVTRSRSSAQPSMSMSGLSGAGNTSTVSKQDGTVPAESICKSRQQLDVHELLESKFVRPVYNTVYCDVKTEERGQCWSKARSEDVFTRSRSYVQSPKFENSSTGLEHVVVVELLQSVKLIDDDVTCMVKKQEKGRFQSKDHLKERGICSVGNYTRYSANIMLSGLVADKKIMFTHLMEYEGVLRWTILDSKIYYREEEYSSCYEGSTLLSWYGEIIDRTIILINVVNAKTYEVTDADYNSPLLFGYTSVRSDSAAGELRLSESIEIFFLKLQMVEMLALIGKEIEGGELNIVEVIPKVETQQWVWGKYKKDVGYKFGSTEVGHNGNLVNYKALNDYCSSFNTSQNLIFWSALILQLPIHDPCLAIGFLPLYSVGLRVGQLVTLKRRNESPKDIGKNKVSQNNHGVLYEVNANFDKPPTLLWCLEFTVHKVPDILQNRIKQHADKNRSERQFQIGEEVYLRLQSFCQNLLVRWMNLNSNHDTWEAHTSFMSRFPSFDPWGQGSTCGGGNVMHEREGREEEVRLEESNLGITKEGLGIESKSIGKFRDWMKEESARGKQVIIKTIDIKREVHYLCSKNRPAIQPTAQRRKIFSSYLQGIC
ncbi:hypothetical protein F3Y22_tig00117056pilonHSYRG00663 [Hibiscus syriacus]|uniref:Uncharacterized protein n=1 Tax=Hibiscus syriacus TaxID=106335 RepID=A0A6A2XJN4_HIBSY|nr:hypothetical protein F3Y22_tig00117056pilonHSYRG00663 [Hibiscus syriacus]